ncbi:hypothetical protein V7S43_010632 [Phytophthora oleae]|uniref:Autophagy protein 5 n=1 Tax=Phytophthora oleae TaxID=2107226 RepID=A0ABD3FBP0_9STRA
MWSSISKMQRHLCPLCRALQFEDGVADLPWTITVHFLNFPRDVLLPCENEQSVESHFMHSLKQATFLRMGSTKAVMALPEAQQTQIWTSIAQNDYESYREATHALHLDGGVDASALRHLPLRVHLDNTPAIQMPIAPLQDGREKTLLEVLNYLLPDLFPSSADLQTHKSRLVVHGISVPAEVSIVELYRNFSYADNFLYVAVLS